MKINTTTTAVMLVIASAVFSLPATAQKGFNLQFDLQLGNTVGGDYQVPVDASQSNPYAWTSLSKKFTFGAEIGVDAGYNFTDKMGVSLGMHYASLGQDYSDYVYNLTFFNPYPYNITFTYQRSVSLKYLRIPFQFNFVLSPDKRISFAATAGFYAGVLLSYRDEIKYFTNTGFSGNETATGTTYTITMTDPGGNDFQTYNLLPQPYYPIDAGIILGAGMQLKLTDKMFLPLMFYFQTGVIDIKDRTSQINSISLSTGGGDLFWQSGYANSPNETNVYKNSSVGFRMGFKICFASASKAKPPAAK